MAELRSRADLLATGLTERQIDYRLASGTWSRRRSGLYVGAETLDGLSPRERFLLDVQAAQRRVSGSVASHGTALLIHRLAAFGPTGPITLTKPSRDGDTPTAYPGLRVLAAGLPASDVTDVDGVRVTSLARTVCDRARTSSFMSGVVSADCALAGGLQREHLLDVLARCRRWPGRLKAIDVAKFAEPLTESPLESISRVFFRDRHLPAPRPQVSIRDSQGFLVARVDFLWEEESVAGEADGDIKYRQPWSTSDLTSLAPLLAEKRRQEAVEDEGLVVVRWDLDGLLQRGDQTEARIRAGFARAARRRAS